MRLPLCLTLLAVAVKCQVIDDVNRLYQDKLSNYEKRIRPVILQSHAVQVYITFTFRGLRSFDDLSGKANFLSSFTFRWKEDRLTWNASEYGGVEHIVLPHSDVWTPDVIMVDYPDLKNAPGTNSKNVKIEYNGNAAMNSLDMLETICTVDITKYPFDRQICKILITPWGYSSDEIELIEDTNHTITVAEPDTESHSAWLLTDVSLSVTSTVTFSRLSITIKFERRSLYVIANLIIPIFTLGFLNPWVFLLPQESGERTSFSITVLLSFAVYMGILSDNMPKGSQPLSDMNYLMICMLMYSVILLFLTVVSLRIYNNNGQKDVPKYLRYCMRIIRCKHFYNIKTTSDVTTIENRQQTWADAIEPDDINKQSLVMNNPQHASSIRLQDETTVTKAEMERADHKEDDVCPELEVTWIDIGKVFDNCALVFALILWAVQLIMEYKISMN
ncbi:acetylcholine receptor subunit alpha-like [Mercenaria mercenaria]|uniref:acetylcholine receptor subunit alpha-like n=1 Tax=Mercenaria mercenaria TaxID=6596 RepID=UPI001E1D7254|nr:acetylcholine receptor subunit alpha-like [Mercenaria mercenaria]